MEIQRNKTALIAMSGGVDSSVAAYLMKEAGYTCMGATMKLFENEDIGVNGESSCCSLSDVEDARSVAYRLDIPYHVFNFTGAFRSCVVDPFVETYEQGGTPNPCIHCNRYLKFEKLLQRARELELEYIVTGHYARVSYDAARGRYLLRKAVDLTKDQSYVLYFLSQEQLAHIQFPLGDYEKTQVRVIAEKNGFFNARKKESQDICFVPDGDYVGFIERYTGKHYPAGNFCDLDEQVLGQHKGFIGYTIGQRKGLGIALGKPMYVCRKDRETNTVYLGENADLFSDELTAGNLNLISCDHLEGSVRLSARIRYNQKEQPATVTQLDADTIRVQFDQPQRAITRGQAVVLYDGDLVVGGGTIL